MTRQRARIVARDFKPTLSHRIDETMGTDSYRRTGVNTIEASKSVARIGGMLRKTFEYRGAGMGRVLLDLGYYANVIDLGNNTGLAISTDGVGTKILVAQAMDKYDTVGIDCVAMNVNDLLCVGATPLSLVDYIAVETADSEFIAELVKGLCAGAEQANISIPAGEIAQVRELIHGGRAGKSFDLVATCVGTVPADRILVGRDIRPGDAVVGLWSSGIHSNGYTLARRVLLEQKRLPLDQPAGGLNRPLGEELLEPTLIYVKPVVEMFEKTLDIKALLHITGDGLLNLIRVDAPAGFIIEELPATPPIFQLIQEAGGVSDEEMFTVFNMGVGFCLVVDPAEADAALEIARRHGFEGAVIGKTVHDPARTVTVAPKNLIGRDGAFAKG